MERPALFSGALPLHNRMWRAPRCTVATPYEVRREQERKQGAVVRERGAGTGDETEWQWNTADDGIAGHFRPPQG
jgi:hypothetical protein